MRENFQAYAYTARPENIIPGLFLHSIAILFLNSQKILYYFSKPALLFSLS